ncbi:MAG TPA: DinB family protein, partial [Acidimicrobiales bacterium]|nr:DinB family protein [Acidimicrobiales bacterium]
AAVVEEAGAWRRFLDQSDDGFLRTNPGPVIFSPMQYGAHVRDMLRVAGDRMIRGRDEDNPVVPIFNPPEETFFGYNQLDRGELAADLEGQAQRLAGIIDGMDAAAWSRTVTNDRGRYGVYSFTLAGLACNAAHEAHHHLLDANGTLTASSAS